MKVRERERERGEYKNFFAPRNIPLHLGSSLFREFTLHNRVDKQNNIHRSSFMHQLFFYIRYKCIAAQDYK